MKEVKPKLTLDRPATYEIKVPGHLDESWTEWDARMTLTVENEGDGPPDHNPDLHHRPGCFTRPVAPALFPGLAVDLGHLR